MHDYNAPAPLLTVDDYRQAKEASRVSVVLTPAMAQDIQSKLEYDDHPEGSRGRALTGPVGATLRAKDRLEIIEGNPDISVDICSIAPGTTLHFFRPAKENRLIFWCELFFNTEFGDPALGPDRIVGDLLHTGDGGVASFTGGTIFERLLHHAGPALGVLPSGNKVEFHLSCTLLH